MRKMIYTGMKRRKSETVYVSVVTFIAILFMTGITLFQMIMNNYVFSTNLYNYGDWIISSVNRKCTHPYLLTESSLTTGTKIVDDQGMSLEIYTGKADENFQNLYDEILYEGNMPTKDDEIAMDISTLAILGYSYDLGQSIEISVMDEEGVVYSKSYVLVGTLKDFSTIWKQCFPFHLPSILFTENAFESYKRGSFKTYFYQLNPEYNDIRTYDFAQSFVPIGELAETNPVTYNNYVYENKVWGSTETFDHVTRALMLIAVAAIGYLLISYTGKRREIYYRYRCIGATMWQMRGIVLLECLSITIPQIVVGMLGAYAGAALGCQIAQWNQINIEYIFEVELFIVQIVVACVVVTLSIVTAQISISDKHLAGNTGRVKPEKYNILRKLSRIVKNTEKSLFLRQDILHPTQKLLSSVFTVLACGCLILSIFKIYHEIEQCNRILNSYNDFDMNYKMEQYDFEKRTPDQMVYQTSIYPSDISLGVDDVFLDAIMMSPGVEKCNIHWIDETHYFQWEGMEESTVMQYLESQMFYGTPLEYNMKMYFYQNVSDLQKTLKEEELEYLQSIDWESVEKGEQGILFVDTSIGENNLAAGDTIDICHFEDGYTMSVTLSSVVEQESSYKSYKLIGTKALAERIVKTEQKELKYSRIGVMYDANASYESTDKQMATCAVNNGFEYQSKAERRRMAINKVIESVGIYGTLFTVILIVYVILQRNFLTTQLKYMQEKYYTLKRIGMEDSQYMRYALFAEAKKFLWMIPGMGLGYLLIFRERLVFHQMSETAEELILDAAIMEVQMLEDIWFFLFVGILYVVMVGSAVGRIQRFIERENR